VVTQPERSFRAVNLMPAKAFVSNVFVSSVAVTYLSWQSAVRYSDGSDPIKLASNASTLRDGVIDAR